MKSFWFLPVLAALALTVFYYHQWQHWLAFATGSYNVQGIAHNYNAFSGSLSLIGNYTIATSLVTTSTLLWRSHTCHRYWWCWRHGSHCLEGTPYKLCGRHHPEEVPSVKESIDSYGNGTS